MIKSFLILISFSIFLYSSQQIVLVVADDFNTSKAKLQGFEEDKLIIDTIDVNIGKKGLGWGLGLLEIAHNPNEVIKIEGDKKAPIGIFKLSSIFGYAKDANYKLPYIYTSEKLICVDDANSQEYNKIISMPQNKPKSFEYMKRKDKQYELGIVVDHNKEGTLKRGSCIFIHVQKAPDAGTAGCTAMKLKDLEKITSWLDAMKSPILIQIPKSYAKEVTKLYPQINDSTLLQ